MIIVIQLEDMGNSYTVRRYGKEKKTELGKEKNILGVNALNMGKLNI